MKKNFICVLFTFTFETAKWITLYLKINYFNKQKNISQQKYYIHTKKKKAQTKAQHTYTHY